MMPRHEAMHLNRLRYRLAANGIRYCWLKWTGGAGHAEALSLEVTRRCIARCVMCNIWRTPAKTPQLGLADWLHLLSPPALSRLTTREDGTIAVY
jgi:hypothetical protein